MRWSDLPLNPSSRTLRQFAGLWILFFGGLAAWRWFVLQQPRTAAVLTALAVVVGTLGLASPRKIRLIFVTWLTLAFPVGWVVSRVILVVLFGVVMTPVGLIFRLRGRDLLELRRNSARTTYWKPKQAAPDVASYLRQF